jgi:hypothetical protein
VQAQTNFEAKQLLQSEQPAHSDRVTNEHVSILFPESTLQFQQLQHQQQQEQLNMQQYELPPHDLCQCERQEYGHQDLGHQESEQQSEHQQHHQSEKEHHLQQFEPQYQQMQPIPLQQQSVFDSSSYPSMFDDWIRKTGGAQIQMQAMEEYCMCLREVAFRARSVSNSLHVYSHAAQVIANLESICPVEFSVEQAVCAR